MSEATEASIHSVTQSSSTQSEKVEVNANPTKEITRNVWEKTHTKKDGTISDTTSSYFDKIVKSNETINDSDEEDFSLDEGDSEELKVRMENAEGTVKTLVDLFKGYMGQGNCIPDIVFNVGGNGTRRESVGRMLNIDVVDQLNSPGSANQKCEILNYDLEVIATGSVCKDSTISIMHGKPIPPTHEKLVVDNILLPDEKTTKQNHPLAMIFAEVGIGGYVCHPKIFIQYL